MSIEFPGALMFWKSFRLTLAGILFFVLCPRLRAAESAIIRYSILEFSVSVAELSRLSETGEVAPALASQLKRANKEPEQLRQALNQTIPIDPILLSRILNNPIGENLLDRASDVIHTPSKSASRQALRSALVTSALDDNKIQLIEILENYPTSEVHVNGERLVSFMNQINGIIASIPRLPRLPF